MPVLDGARLRPRQAARTAAGRLEFIVRRHADSHRPTIVLVNGAGVGLKGWSALFPAIEAFGTVVAYNRFGVGGSAPPRSPQHAQAVVATLRELLASGAGVAPPYLLVGHSLGGLCANLFARLHPGEVSGCVLIESTHPQDWRMLREHEAQVLRGLGHVLRRPQERFRDSVHSELKWIAESARQVESAGPFPPVPLAVVSGGRAPPASLLPPAALRARRRHQQELAQLSPLGRQWVAQRSGHFPQVTEPRLVLDVLRRVAALVGS